MNSREEFEKWYVEENLNLMAEEKDVVIEAWNYQQKKIDALEATLKKQNESIATLIDVITEAADV